MSRRIVLLSFACLILASTVAAAPKHPAIFLVDKEGDEINPITGENASAPFSTQWTCGMCHDYDEITEGYHFQMGWDNIDDDYGTEQGLPWSLSNGFMGRWYPYAFRQLAKKENESPDEIDLTVYDFVGFSSPGPGQLPCGACHPGGGGLQYDRDGNRYDEMMLDDPELAESLDGDYYRAKWDKSGVVEADCFVCHLERYNFDARVEQLEIGNYQWAVVAGSRIGIVEGGVTYGDEPEVTYNSRLFNEDGSITLEMSWPPPDENCVYCHGNADVRKRGFSWNDVFNPDVHNQQGISCAACHPAGLDHQMAQGDANVSTIAPELENSIRDCEECHSTGYLGAPVPLHHKERPSHLRSIACESCHIPSLGRAAALGHETTTGKLEFYVRPDSADDFGESATWEPVYERRAHNDIYPFNSVLAIWWGNRDADGLIYPLFLREHEDAWKLFEDKVTDDNDDGKPEVNRPEEVRAGIAAFTEALQTNERFAEIDPVFVKAERAWYLDEQGELVSDTLDGTPLAGATHVEFSISHNVAPTRMALGADGCGDCHDYGANFFKGQRIVDMYDSEGQPVTKNMGRYFGCNPVSFAVNTFHQQIVSPYIGPLIIIVIFLIVLHYHSYGPKRITFDPYSQEIQRFSFLERAVHLFRLISFVVLTVTGLIMAFNLNLWQELLFGNSHNMFWAHYITGVIFVITTIGGIFLWFRDAIFADYDKDWVKQIGGYLGYKGKVPAGRFNAGQKMFFWYTTIFGAIISISGILLMFKGTFALSTICITSTVHNLIGFVLIAGVLAHAYLGTIANPGTWRVLVDGSVTREWAEHHHPQWYRKLLRKGVVKDKGLQVDEQEEMPDDPDKPSDKEIR